VAGVAKRNEIELFPDKPTKGTYLLGEIAANEGRNKYKPPRRVVPNAHPFQGVPLAHTIKIFFKGGIHLPLHKNDNAKNASIKVGISTGFLLNCPCFWGEQGPVVNSDTWWLASCFDSMKTGRTHDTCYPIHGH
jgi:hypothetical protein